jgi:6-pyruvoyltetrahydropterin/6-carboxytetrahydropterin synthase
MVYVTRKSHFCASHRLHNPSWSDEKNAAVFGKCNNPNGHGHNYDIEVTVGGEPPADTGMVIDLKKLRDIIEQEIVERVESKIHEGRLVSIRLFESENNVVEYRGE